MISDASTEGHVATRLIRCAAHIEQEQGSMKVGTEEQYHSEQGSTHIVRSFILMMWSLSYNAKECPATPRLFYPTYLAATAFGCLVNEVHSETSPNGSWYLV